MGRPAAPAHLIDQARELVAAGAHLREAALVVGVDPNTLGRHGIRPSSAGVSRHREASARHAHGLRKRWDRSSIIDAFHEWAAEHGGPPCASDWNPAMARRQGREDRARRHASGQWPYYSTVVAYFGSWSAGLEAAGWHPRDAGHYRPPATA